MCVPARPRTVLRPAQQGDAAVLSLLRLDRGLQHLLMANPDPEPPVDPVTDAKAWIARRKAAGWFRVIDRGDGAQGFVQITDIHRKNRFGWLGIALASQARGAGLGALALAEAEQIALSDLGLRKLLLLVRADNAAALALYHKADWTRVGRLQDQYDDGDALHDAIICEKLLGSVGVVEGVRP